MLITFVIPHRGRVDMLCDTLTSIARQNFDSQQYQVVVVTQNEQGSLDELLVSHANAVKCIYSDPGLTISHLRNLGVEHTESEYLAFLDADIALSENWIATMLELLNDAQKQRVIVSAVQKSGDNPPPLEVIRTELSNAKVDCDVEFLPGRNLFMRRTDFTKIGGFPEHLITCEDYYFTDKAAKLGALYYSALANYVHLGEDKDFWQMYKKEIWRGQSNLLSIKGRQIPLSEYPSFLAPLWVCFFLIAALILSLAGSSVLALLSLALGVFPLLLYTVRLYLLGSGQIRWLDALKFYGFYFPARAYGTLVGFFKAIDIKTQ